MTELGMSDALSDAAIEESWRWLRAYVVALTGDRSEADDLVQQVIVIAFRKKDSLRPGSNVGGWLRGIARNVVREYWKRRARTPVITDDEAVVRLDRLVAGYEAYDRMEQFQKERETLLRECVEGIRDHARELLRRRYELGQSMQEIAEAVGMGVGAIKASLFRIKEALAKCVRRKSKEAIG